MKSIGTGAKTDPPVHKRIAVMLDLQWAYKRHTGIFIGSQRFAREQGDWDCSVDEFAQTTLAENADVPVYDGIIARATPALAQIARKLKVPLVNVWLNSQAAASLPGVFNDFKASGKMAAEHLLQRGFRNFACLSGAGDKAQRIAREGFHEAIEKKGCKCSCQSVERMYYEEVTAWKRFRRDVRTWIDRWKNPIGVYIAFPEMTARHVAEAVREAGLKIPEHVAIIQGENDTVLSVDPPPSLSSVDLVYETVGYQAAAMLNDLIAGKAVKELHQFIEPAGAAQPGDAVTIPEDVVARGAGPAGPAGQGPSRCWFRWLPSVRRCTSSPP